MYWCAHSTWASYNSSPVRKHKRKFRNSNVMLGFEWPFWVIVVGNFLLLIDCWFPVSVEWLDLPDVRILYLQLNCICLPLTASNFTYPVRLVNGTTLSEGRVEVYIHEHWSTVCDYSFSTSDAEVVCEQLGHTGRPLSSPPLHLGFQ